MAFVEIVQVPDKRNGWAGVLPTLVLGQTGHYAIELPPKVVEDANFRAILIIELLVISKLVTGRRNLRLSEISRDISRFLKFREM